jgi:hypothetical protein
MRRLTFMSPQPTIELRSLSIGFQESVACLDGPESGANHEAVCSANPLPCQPGGELAQQTAILVM